MSLGPVIDDAARTVTKDDFFFYSYTQNVSERGLGFFYYSMLVGWLEHKNVVLTILKMLLLFSILCKTRILLFLLPWCL